MKRNIINFILSSAVVFMTACGTDSKENAAKPEGDGTYAFYNATTPLVIKQNSTCSGGTCPNATKITKTATDTNTTKEIIISVQLLKFGLVEAGEIVEMKPFDRKYGFLTNSLAVTDMNGRASFIYNLPENFDAIRGQNITIQAVYAEKEEGKNASSPYEDKPKNILLTQDFVLQFR